MELEFDKEIDSLLRQTAKGENVFAAKNPSGEHIDADEISMFAENALPEKAKSYITKHLASCDRCRTILSNTILLNAEAESEIAALIPVRETKAEKVVNASAFPWYKSLFSTRNLAFGTGALAIIFAVGIGFLFLQKSSNSEMQTAQANTNSADFEAASNLSKTEGEEMADSGAALMNSNMESLNENANANAAMDSANLTLKKENELKDSVKKETTESDDNSAKKPRVSASLNVDRDVSASDSVAEKNEVTNDDTEEIKDLPINGRNPETTKSTRAAPPPPASMTARNQTNAEPQNRENNDVLRQKSNTLSKVSTTKRINGKIFNRKDNVWYDSNYKGQTTINVKRETEQYKNLDSGLQSIGNLLAGTIVVIWKEQAYRIQ